ncbi:GntR family transcriptional regulator [Paenibacillus solisilvae]|uniref:GntR family transcriptional regulator n=1 Tax=Paenibacillus solisilvae TaxID=2486751 RepID=A0ABW0W2U2_9BACL
MRNERSPLYFQIKQYIQDGIIEGKYGENGRIPTENELMEKFSVSRITVKNALNLLAQEGWIYRIPGRGSFVNDKEMSIKQKLAEHESSIVPSITDSVRAPVKQKKIGLIMPGIDDYFAIGLLWGIQRILNVHDFSLTIMLSAGDKEKESKAIRELMAQGAAGLLIFPIDEELYNEEILSLKVHEFPFVLIDRYLPGVETNYIASDGMLGARLAVRYLWELGHRNIAICSNTPPSTVTVQERLQGYMNELTDQGSLINPAHILMDLDKSQVQEEDPLYQYLKNGMATAYITLNGHLGIHVARAAEQIGLRVPEDISIVTFDNPAPYFDDRSFFTHISQSEEEIGERATQILMDIILGHNAMQNYRKILVEPKMVTRKSAGPAKQAK